MKKDNKLNRYTKAGLLLGSSSIASGLGIKYGLPKVLGVKNINEGKYIKKVLNTIKKNPKKSITGTAIIGTGILTSSLLRNKAFNELKPEISDTKVKVKNFIRKSKGKIIKVRGYDRNKKLKTINFATTEINVKSGKRKTRSGKWITVKAYKRKQDKNNKLIRNTAIGIAATLGISTATYGALKFRYLKNLDNFAANLKPSNLKLLTDKNNITFTIGGFKSTGNKQASPLEQAIWMKSIIRNKKSEIIPFDYPAPFDVKKTGFKHSSEMIKALFKNIIKGKNENAQKLAQDVYDYYVNNPGKPINLLAYSNGTNITRDVDYILRKKGVNLNIVNLGSADFKIVPSKQNTLNITSNKDLTYPFRGINAKEFNNVASHSLEHYLRNKDVVNEIKQHLKLN